MRITTQAHKRIIFMFDIIYRTINKKKFNGFYTLLYTQKIISFDMCQVNF